MLRQDRTDVFLGGAFATIVLTVVAVSFGYVLSSLVGLLAFFLFLYLWLTSGLEEVNGDSTSA